MKTVYIIYTDRYGENDLVFDDKFKSIGGWSCNDATWRNEYFGGLMEKLGINVLDSFPEGADEHKLVSKALVEQFGRGADKE